MVLQYISKVYITLSQSFNADQLLSLIFLFPKETGHGKSISSRIFIMYLFGQILRIEACPDDHPAEVPEAMLTTHDEKRLIKVRVVFPQLLLLNLSAQTSTEVVWQADNHAKGLQGKCMWIYFLRFSLLCDSFSLQIPFHFCLFFLFLDHLDLTVLPLSIAVAHCAGMLGEKKTWHNKPLD